MAKPLQILCATLYRSYIFHVLSIQRNKYKANLRVSYAKPPSACYCMDVKQLRGNSSESASFVPTVFQLVSKVDACWLCQSWLLMDLPADRFIMRKWLILQCATQRSNCLFFVCLFYCRLENLLCDKICSCDFAGLYTQRYTVYSTACIFHSKCLIF